MSKLHLFIKRIKRNAIKKAVTVKFFLKKKNVYIYV